MTTAIFLAILNLALCTGRFLKTLFERRLITAAWFLLSYFGLFMLLLTIEGPFRFLQGFTAQYVYIKEPTITFASGYMLICNLLFFVSEYLAWRLLGRKVVEQWELPRRDTTLSVLKGILACFLVGGTFFYWTKMKGLGYTQYVELMGTNWPIVFFWASGPLISICALQRRYFFAAIGTIPFLFFAYKLQVRSFALLSLIPAVIIFVMQVLYRSALLTSKRKAFRIVAGGLLAMALLAVVSGFLTYTKSGKGGFPDAGLPYGMNMAIEGTQKTRVYTGWVSMRKYGENIVMPFYKLFNIELSRDIDTPTHIAHLIDGVPKLWPRYFHYPVLWYADAFVSFGNAGLLLGLLWGLIFSFFEYLIRRSALVLGLFLPFYVWHTYMFCRGATAIATVPFAYTFYVVLMVWCMATILGTLLGKKL
jgi:hypothetical protein